MCETDLTLSLQFTINTKIHIEERFKRYAFLHWLLFYVLEMNCMLLRDNVSTHALAYIFYYAKHSCPKQPFVTKVGCACHDARKTTYF
jgi:hypothetical protein